MSEHIVWIDPIERRHLHRRGRRIRMGAIRTFYDRRRYDRFCHLLTLFGLQWRGSEPVQQGLGLGIDRIPAGEVTS